MTVDIDAFRDDVIEVTLSTITSYIITWLPKSDNLKELVDLLHHPLKGVLSTQLGRFEQCGNEVLKSLTDCWHAFAKVSVDAGVRSWDNYLSLGGRDAWQSFDDTWHKRQYEVYFVARFVEYNKEAWREWQIPILQLWIASLLHPDTRFKYQADLTTQIMRYDASFNPLLFHLPLVIYEDEVLVEVNFDELVTARTPLIVALLRNMNKITTRPDSQDTIFGPSQDDCSAILKNMIAQMKQYLQEFEREPDNFEVYTAFVGRILLEMRIYTNHLEPVPEFFEYSPGKSLLLAPDTIKAKLKTYKQLLIDNVMEKHMIVFMHTTAERAAITGQQKALEDQLVSVFLDLNPESIEDAEGYAADAHFRTLFFQNVFPAYLDRIFHGPGFIIAQPILQCILMVYKSLRFQFGFWRKEFLEPFTTATLTLLATLKTTLAGLRTSQERILSDPSQLRAYAYLSLLMFEILCRCQEMEDSFGPFGALADIWEYFLFFYKFTYTVAFRPPLALPGRPPDDDGEDQIPLLEPELSRTDAGMLAYSRQELGDRLDFKWLPGADGKWHVRGTGGRRELVQGDGGVRILEEEARNMHTAAERYVRAFSALWDAY
jgi:hypothetical protein